MTKQVSGVIESINFGTAKDGEFGRSAPCWVKVNGESYSCFVKEFNGRLNLQTKVGEVYTDIKEGMQVVFEATQKGDYWNFKPSKLIILASGSATPQTTAPQPTEQPQKPVGQRSAPQVDNDAVIRSNCLVAAAIKAHGSLSQEDYKKLDMDMLYRAADTYMDYCKNGRK